MFSLYWIVNTVTMKGYVGFTGRTTEWRFEQHKKAARNGSVWLLHAAMRKYGVENFQSYFLLTVADRTLATSLEMQLIVGYGTRAPLGYNMTDGGDGATGYRHTEEWKVELGRRRRGRKCSPEQIATMSTRMIGWQPSQETRKRMSASHIGLQHPAKTKQKMSQSAIERWVVNPPKVTPDWIERCRTLRLGATNSVEHNAAIAAALKGRPKSVVARTNIRLAALRREEQYRKEGRGTVPPNQKGKKLSEQTRANMRAAQQRRRNKVPRETSFDIE